MTKALSIRDQIKALHSQNVTVPDIARELGITKNAVRGYLHRAGLKPSKGSAAPYRPTWTQADIGVLEEMAEQGATSAEAAQKLNRTVNAVLRRASDSGIYFDNQRRCAAGAPALSDSSGKISLPSLKFLEGNVSDKYVMVKA